MRPDAPEHSPVQAAPPETLALPGIEPPPTGAGLVEQAAHRTIAALTGVLDERHAVVTQTLLTLARQLDRASTAKNAKDYGVAQLVAQMRECYVLLVPPIEGGGGEGDPFDELARKLWSSAQTRDSAQT